MSKTFFFICLKTKNHVTSFVRVKELKIFFLRGITIKSVFFVWLRVRRFVSSRLDITAASIGEENSDLALFLFGTSAGEKGWKGGEEILGPRRVNFYRTINTNSYEKNVTLSVEFEGLLSFVFDSSFFFHNNLFLHFWFLFGKCHKYMGQMA